MFDEASLKDLLEYNQLPVEVRQLAERVLYSQYKPRENFNWSDPTVPVENNHVLFRVNLGEIL